MSEEPKRHLRQGLITLACGIVLVATSCGAAYLSDNAFGPALVGFLLGIVLGLSGLAYLVAILVKSWLYSEDETE